MELAFSQDTWHLILRILVASVLGGILGLERDMRGRGAGLRTHLLVSAGAALFMILSLSVANLGLSAPADVTKVTDPGRIAAQIITGIGFLGAGVIIKAGFTIRGLTTAACLWVAAAIGMSAGAGRYGLAAGTTLLALLSLVALRLIEGFYRKDSYRDLLVTVPMEVDIRRIIQGITGKGIRVLSYSQDRDYENQTSTAVLSLRLSQRDDVDQLSHVIIKKLEQMAYVFLQFLNRCL